MGVSSQPLREVFSALGPAAIENEAVLVGVRIPGRTKDYVARRSDGAPLVLIAAQPTGTPTPSIRLRYLHVDFAAYCRIQDGDELREGHFVVLTCGAEEPTLFELFFEVCHTMLSHLDENPAAAVVHVQLARLIELFRKLAQPARSTLKGIWAELFVIAESDKPEEWVRAWHQTAWEKFDFSFPAVKVEVKATELPSRIHEFSIQQLLPPAGFRCHIASMQLRESSAGATVLMLARRVAEAIKADSEGVAKVWANVAEGLGSDYLEWGDVRYDEAFAREAIRFIDSSLVPRPVVVDSSVFDVRFKTDLGDLAASAPTAVNVGAE